MADIRVTTGHRSRVQGTTVGMQVNVFGLQKLEAGVTGEALAAILEHAGEVPLQDAKDNWPGGAVGGGVTLASLDSIEFLVTEINPKSARAVLQVGGPKLMGDPRNKSGKDYAPFIEFNGSPTGRGKFAIAGAIINNDKEIRQRMHDGVARLIVSINGQ